MLPKNFQVKDRSWTIDVFTLTGIFILFYTFWLGSYPLFTPDEGRYSEVAREMLASGDFITPRVDGVAFLDKPVLYYWLQAASIYLFGVKEWAIRLFPMLFGILGIVATYVFGRQLYNRRTAIISAIVLATSLLYFCSAHYANLDLEVGVLISCALFSFITAMHTNNSKLRENQLLLLAYFFAALACLTKGMIGLAFPVIIIGTWILLLWRWDVLKEMLILPGVLIVTLINLPWYYLVQKANPAFLHYFFVTQQVTRFLSHATFNNAMPIWFYIPVILFGLFPWSIFLFQALKQSGKQVWNHTQNHPVELFLLIWSSAILLFFSIPSSKAVTYIMPIFPPLALLIGKYISHHWENAQWKGINWAILNFSILALFLAGGLLSIVYYQTFDVAPEFNNTLKKAALLFLSAPVVVLFCFRRKTLLPLFSCCIIVSTLFLIMLLQGAVYLNPESTKALATNLKPILKPQDEVVNYYKFYQDLPLYLGQRVTIVTDWNSPQIQKVDNWRRELWYGMPFQKTDWLINEDAFWQRWNSDKRVFVFLNENYFNRFTRNISSYFIIGKSNEIYLLSNKPTIE